MYLGVLTIFALTAGLVRSMSFPKQLCGVRSIPWAPKRQVRIVGGENPPIGAVPWVVDLLYKKKHYCGGVLVSSRLVLTVAHCYIEGLTARVGAHTSDLSVFEQNLPVERGVQHPDFRKFGPYSNDIAVLLLAFPGVQINSFVKPTCVPDHVPLPGTWCEVSGWGAKDPKSPENISSELQTASVPLLSLEVCRKKGIYGGRRQAILDTMVCAGRLQGGVDACGGDSGGPLMCEADGRLILTGLVSWGDGCAKKLRPGVYTRVSSYRNWIVNTGLELATNNI